MGWTFLNKPKGIGTKQFLTQEFSYTSEDGTYCRVLDCAVVNLREAYLAVERGHASGLKKVFALVCLLEYRPNDFYNFGYKDMDEDMHPYFYNCPERILNLLTPTENEWAQEWRKRCYERLKKKRMRPRLRKGEVIRFESPIRFSDGSEESVFRVEDPRRLVLSDRTGWRYKIRRRTLESVPYQVIEDFPIQNPSLMA